MARSNHGDGFERAQRQVARIEAEARAWAVRRMAQMAAELEAAAQRATPGGDHHRFVLHCPPQAHGGPPVLRLGWRAPRSDGTPGPLRFTGKGLRQGALPAQVLLALWAFEHAAERREPAWSPEAWRASTARRTWVLRPGGEIGVLAELCRRGLLVAAQDEAGVAARPVRWIDARLQVRIGLRRETGDGPIRAEGTLVAGDAAWPIASDVAWMSSGVVLMGDALGVLACREHAPWVARLAQADVPLSPAEVDALLAQRAAERALEVLAGEGVVGDEVMVPPRPRLRVARLGGWRLLPASTCFVYDGIEVNAATPGTHVLDATGRRLRRDRDLEQRAIDELKTVWPDADPTALQWALPIESVPRVVSELHRCGFEILVRDQRLRAPGARTFRVRASGRDWFDLEGVQHYGDAAVPFPELLRALERKESVVALPDGSLGLLPEDWLRGRRVLLGFGTARGSAVRFGRSQAALLDVLVGDDAVEADAAFAKARAGVRRAASIGPADAGPEFRCALRPYQREGLGWLRYLREVGFGGCLADDMGLGKTVQVLALLDDLRASDKPSLVVAPLSLLFHWREQAERFAPRLSMRTYHGAARQRELAELQAGGVLLTTYGTLRLDAAALAGVAFDTVVLDEAQAIKNAGTDTARAARSLDAERRLALSGTPLENHLGELVSLFEFLNPGMLGGSRVLAELLAKDEIDAADCARLAQALRPFLLRRTKREVAPDLPERVEQTLHCVLGESQQKLYDELRDHFRAALLQSAAQEGRPSGAMHVLEALLRLRQAACHPGLIDDTRAGESCAKFDALLPMLEELGREGHKALVFSQFTSLLALLRRELDARRIAHEYLDGSTRDRAAAVARFQQDPQCGVFLISLKAGGLGLNLTAASYVFLLDPWWNPAAEAQAIDRAHRIGQTRSVTAYRLLAPGTVEDKIAQLQAEKRELADALLGGDNATLRGLDLEELRWLLE